MTGITGGARAIARRLGLGTGIMLPRDALEL
jgi:hypothetical protein